jgi:hypothetical protein
VDQLKFDTCHLINYFLKKKFKKKKERKSWSWGGYGHPHGAKGVAETTPKPPLGVVSATPLGPWERSSHPMVPKGVASQWVLGVARPPPWAPWGGRNHPQSPPWAGKTKKKKKSNCGSPVRPSEIRRGETMGLRRDL